MFKIKILIVEDEVEQGQLIQQILEDNGYQTHYVDSAELAKASIRQDFYDIIISDWRLGDKDGLWLLDQVNSLSAKSYFILATAYGSIQHAVKAITLGAKDYLTKPYSRDQLIFAVDRAAENINLTQENQQLKKEIKHRNQLVDMVGNSQAIQKIFYQVEKLAPTNATIHISGGSGTGKELAARALHKLSPRNQNPFIVVNCGAIPEGLAEAELFGAEKGSYTGSTAKKIGCFEAADGGTLFLDEVAELSPNIQTKLLRVLQESSITRIGSNKEISIDVRIISATHKSLSDLVIKELFREDLLYRLNVIPIIMPPLRDRIEDLPELVSFFNNKHSKAHEMPSLKITDNVLKQFESYAWPGNIRELSHTIERLMLLSEDGKIVTEDLHFTHRTKASIESLVLPKSGIKWSSLEQSFYRQALEYSAGNKKKAAKLLGLTYKSFLYRLEKFLISD